ncbi:MAG: spermidine/putrescine ABC transporter substrate-binding protein [Clostridia bacterium]|nr:spermidine/putrescine ABC transporter substrate-binding protein [Clostridia bacterium]
MKKRIFSLMLALVLLSFPVLMTSCSIRESRTTTLYVYNWGEYISDGSEDSYDSNAAFEQWYYETYHERVEVNYSTYSSNESLLAKLSSGSVSYDVIVPSDYMIERMIEEDMLAPLRYENIPNAKTNLRPEFFGENAKFDEYDKGNVYSVPYFYGMIGIIYNQDLVLDQKNVGSWALMWDETYAGNILQFNNSRDAFGTAQYYLGSDVNSDNREDWENALALLKKQKPIVQGYVMDEIFNKMENGSAAIAAYYAGDFLAMYENNDALEFFYPKEGTNLYVDAMCIPKDSENKLIAERYINFMLEEEPAVANAEYTYYASPNRLVYENEEYRAYLDDIKEGAFDTMYDPESMKTASFYRNLEDDKLVLLNSLWEDLKSDISISSGIYVICAIILILLLGSFIFFALRKRYRNNY